ncbi:MAG: Uncharacterised protein [Synechococcus sp. CC9902]|nr:MAG: Uncharacterised protein [Synechococcus sp. CC9902]
MGLRQHLHVEAQQGVAPHLQQDACEQHRHRCVGFAVGIGKPGVQREHRQLDPESHQEAQIAEQTEAAACRAGGEIADVQRELITRKSQRQTADQDQQRGQGGVKDELGGCVLAVLAAPDGDQQIHRHQFQFPGQEEEQEILGEEDQALSRGLNQQQSEVEAGFSLDRPARCDGEKGDQTAEHHQRCRESVDAQGPFQTDGGDPADPFHELETGDRRLEFGGEHHHHQNQVDQQNDQCEIARPGRRLVVRSGKQRHQQRPECRQQHNQGQPGECCGCHSARS